MKKILLLSGGLDSMTLLKDLGKDFFDELVFLDYGQSYMIREYNICKPYITTLIKLKKMKEKDGFYYGRNLNFIISLIEYFSTDLEVYIGNNSNDTYPDNNPLFFNKLEDILNLSYPFSISIKLPYKDLSKRQVWEKAKSLNMNDYYFCYSNLDTPCGKCHSCLTMIQNNIPLI